MNSFYHARSSASKWGGFSEDYQDIHTFIDSSKQHIGDARHRALYHHTGGVWLAERIFGETRTVGRIKVPVREIVERHVIEDLGFLPSPNDYWKEMPLAVWMSGSVRLELPLSHILGDKK